MTSATVGGTEGYAEQADALVGPMDAVRFADLHRPILPLIPAAPCPVLDIGAGTGRDAAAFAAMGHTVVAVEPTAALRRYAMTRHPSPAIAWLDDSLPHLATLLSRGRQFDLVMLTAVWMHLDAAERQAAMPNLARLTATGGRLSITLRHGPVPAGRRMFDVSATETIALAAEAGLQLVLRLDNQPSQFNRTDVTWTRLAFVKPA
ncbi:SAM-dependent methyltransferase [Afipia sp. P52-10]|uniref:class I SAM-dependent methyltransferase n=1 Tax=Afipia sp. P52-10 TaxID=1429916 RepID=UPI0003DF037E|nr:class I SAM-dependent methyltransferase [Afipia sp. P52-10]ETR76309.1 SAM-dependent methyltransferase [Afipia sp. P52-10]